jgi:hypothetical protein
MIRAIVTLFFVRQWRRSSSSILHALFSVLMINCSLPPPVSRQTPSSLPRIEFVFVHWVRAYCSGALCPPHALFIYWLLVYACSDNDRQASEQRMLKDLEASCLARVWGLLSRHAEGQPRITCQGSGPMDQDLDRGRIEYETGYFPLDRHDIVLLSTGAATFFFQVAPHLYWRGWVDPVPDPLLLRKSGSAGNRTQTSGSVAGTLTTRP